MITRLQVRMARTALGWGVRDLARKAGVSPTTVTRFENGAHTRVDTVGFDPGRPGAGRNYIRCGRRNWRARRAATGTTNPSRERACETLGKAQTRGIELASCRAFRITAGRQPQAKL